MSQTAIVLGASQKPERYSHQAVKRFLAAGWETIPVHPAGGTLLDQTVMRSLGDCPQQPTVVSVYLGARLFLPEIPHLVALQPQWVWLNPGADDPEAVTAVEEAGLQIAQVCSLIMLGYDDPLSMLDDGQ